MTATITIALTAATEPQIDAEMARLTGEIAQSEARTVATTNELRRLAGQSQHSRTGRWNGSFDEALDAINGGKLTYSPDRDRATVLLDRLTEQDQATDTLREQLAPLNAEFDRRGGWTRFFLVNNADGHVHSSMACSTCNNGIYATQFKWITEFSGQDEAGIVELAGEKACTTCYPSAPAVGKADARFRSDDEVRSAEFQADKAAKLDGKREKAIFPEDPRKGLTLRDDEGRLVAEPKTIRATELQYMEHATEAYVADIRAKRLLRNDTEACQDRGRYNASLAVSHARMASEALAALATRHGATEDQQRAVYADKLAKKIAKTYI